MESDALRQAQGASGEAQGASGEAQGASGEAQRASEAGRVPTPASHIVILLRTFGRRVLVDPVQEGRLRDVGWAYGLRPVVWAAAVVYVVGALLVIFSGALRTGLELSVGTDTASAVPRAAVPVLLLMIMFTLALFQTAALRGPWWFRGLGMVVSMALLGVWGVSAFNASVTSWITAALAVLVMITIVCMAVRQRRRSFAWWEFPALFMLDGLVVCGALIRFGLESRPLGFDFTPILLQQTVTVLAQLALPISVVAGTALAEITVNATTWAVRLTSRFFDHASPRWAYLLLGALLIIRLAQSGWEAARLDPITQGPVSWIVTAGYLLVMAAVAALLLWIASDAGSAMEDAAPERMAAADLPDHLSRYSFPIAVAMTCAQLPLVVALLLLQAVISLSPTSAAAALPFDVFDLFSSTGLVSVIRLLIAAGLLVLAVRSARRAHGAVAVLLGMIAVMLLPVPLTWLAGGEVPITPDADLLNLAATALTVATLVWGVVRRRMTTARTVGLAGLLILSGLFSYRDFISDPVGMLLGFSGSALVLFGLTWALLTDCDFANGSGRRFVTPTRVLLVLSNFVLAITIVAYVALARDPGATLDLDWIAELGDFVFGTALLVAAFVAVWTSVRADREVV